MKTEKPPFETHLSIFIFISNLEMNFNNPYLGIATIRSFLLSSPLTPRAIGPSKISSNIILELVDLTHPHKTGL